MVGILSSHSKEVSIVTDQHATFSPGEGQLIHVTGRAQANINCCADIDAMAPQCSRNVGIDLFIEVETDAIR